MSDDKRIIKDERKVLEEIEKICEGSIRRINMINYTSIENLYNFNDKGSIIMLGFDFTKMDIDDQKINKLGENVCKLKNLERFLIKIPKD